MANVIPKLKLFLLIGFFAFLINMVAFVATIAQAGNATIGTFIAMATTSFLPFFDIVSLAFLGLPPEVFALFGILGIFFGAVKVFILITIIANFVPGPFNPNV